MNILIINHNIENCGVYQYGKRVGDILKKSKKFNFIYLELNSMDELRQSIVEHGPDFIIYNYLSGTMPWVTPYTVEEIRNTGIKQFCIIHNTQFGFFDYNLHQNPYHPNQDGRNFSMKRPLLEFDYTKDSSKNNDVIDIGTFGFGLKCKNIDKICELVNSQFTEDKVRLNLHLTTSHFGGESNVTEQIKNECSSVITNKNIELVFTSDFLTNGGMLSFLHKNDLNIFLYENYNFYNGISSAVDYALSVKKPIAICKSNMFSHIWDVSPSICVEETPLKKIIENGFDVLESKYSEWTHDSFIEGFEGIVEYVKVNSY
jgi:hypothetical protein